MRHLLRPFALLAVGAAAVPAQQPAVDVLRYTFDVTIPDRGSAVRLAATVMFDRGPGADTLHLDLLAPMRVSEASLGCGSAAAAAPFTHDGRQVHVPLPPLLALSRAMPGNPQPITIPGRDTLCVTVRYAGEPKDGLIISTDTAGRYRAFGDNWPNRARHWLATVDHPSDKALVEWRVEAPAALSVVANGVAAGEAAVAGRTPARRRTTFVMAQPIPTYLMVIAVAPLVRHDLGATACGIAAPGRCTPQAVYTAPEQARYMPGHFAEADSILTFFSRLVGPFAYDGLAHLQSSTRFGGMENAGAIFYNDRLFRTPAGVGTGLVAHETAHQWFGDAVTEREWGHLWLSEGFATYFAALYTEHAAGDSAFAAEMAGIRRTAIEAPEVAERPVIDTAQTDLLALLNRNSYQKGGFVLHMLRQQVGDSAFFGALRDYYATFKHGNAVTDQLQAIVERHANQELGWFFDQWLRRPGFADVAVSWRHDAANGRVELIVEQGGRFTPYRLRLPVDLTLADGTRARVVAEVPAASNATVVLPGRFAARPTALTVDPRAGVFARITVRGEAR